MAFHVGEHIHPWISMCTAILFELVGTINAKLSHGLTSPRPSWMMYVAYVLSVSFLAFALDTTSHTKYGGIDLGVAYATWSGLGTVVAALAGVFLYGETLIGVQIFGIVTTIVGIVLINVAPSFYSAEDEIEEARMYQQPIETYGTLESLDVP